MFIHSLLQGENVLVLCCEGGYISVTLEFCKFMCIQIKIIDIGRKISMAYIEVCSICHESITQAGVAKHLKTAVWI